MHQWEMACLDHFSASKKLEEKDYVTSILSGLKDLCTHDWVMNHRTKLVMLTFNAFMKELYCEFLPEGWEDEIPV